MARAKSTDFTFPRDEVLDGLTDEKVEWDHDDRALAFGAQDYDEGTSHVDHKMSFLRELEKGTHESENYSADDRGLDEGIDYISLEKKLNAFRVLDAGHDLSQYGIEERKEICDAIVDTFENMTFTDRDHKREVAFAVAEMMAYPAYEGMVHYQDENDRVRDPVTDLPTLTAYDWRNMHTLTIKDILSQQGAEFKTEGLQEVLDDGKYTVKHRRWRTEPVTYEILVNMPRNSVLRVIGVERLAQPAESDTDGLSYGVPGLDDDYEARTLAAKMTVMEMKGEILDAIYDENPERYEAAVKDLQKEENVALSYQNDGHVHLEDYPTPTMPENYASIDQLETFDKGACELLSTSRVEHGVNAHERPRWPTVASMSRES